MNYDRTIRQIEETFDDEKRFLIQGNIIQLNQVANRKEKLLLSLQGISLPNRVLERFSMLASRNESLIQAAQDGLISARARLTEIQRGALVETYSRSGQKTELSKPIRTLQRRA